MLAVDHVIVAVDDLEVAAHRFYARYGLGSIDGGRHSGHGTGNRIVPLGDGYVELMAVVDRQEAASSSLGSWLARRLLDVGEGPTALCLRTDDIDAVAARTGRTPLAMSRTRPDGVELEWHLVALDAALTDGLPFFIQWHVAPEDHPGRAAVEHRQAAVGIEWVEVGGDQDRLASWLGPHDLPIRCGPGAPGPHRLAVGPADGEPIVIG